MSGASATRKALQKRRKAAQLRSEAAHLDAVGASDVWRRSKADQLEREADEMVRVVNPLPVTSGGEVIPASGRDSGTLFQVRDTLQAPSMVTEEASIARTDLLSTRRLDVAALGLDTAATVQAQNSVERMLAHQMALAHKLSFDFADRALAQSSPVEQARLANVSVRLMDSFQRALLTLQRLRTGGNQTVTVQHVHIEQGGQALIGNVQGRACAKGASE